MHAVLRRTRGDTGNALRFADVELDEDTYEVSRAGERIELTPTEFSLLRFLLQNPRRVLSKRRSSTTCGSTTSAATRTSSRRTCRYLRRKLDRHGPPLIHTVRLVGYVLREV